MTTPTPKQTQPQIRSRFDLGENIVADVMLTRFAKFVVVVFDLDSGEHACQMRFFLLEEEAVAHARELSSLALAGEPVQLFQVAL